MVNIVKQQAKSKTNWVGVAVACMGVLETNVHMLQDTLGQYYGMTYIALGMVMIVLRNVTTTAIGDK